MKKLFLTGAAALLIVATGCKGGTQQEKELAAQQDTLSMAIAEMFAADYARQTMYMPDSLQFDKAEFLKGVQAALAADTTLAGQSYLAGLQQGIQMNMVIESIAKQNDIELDKSDILDAFKEAIAPDSIAASAEQANNKAMTALRKIKEIKLADDPKAMTNKKRSADFMADLKKQANARSLSDNVVCVTETVGDGAKVNASDIVRIKYTMTSMLSKQQLDRTGDNPREMQPAAIAADGNNIDTKQSAFGLFPRHAAHQRVVPAVIRRIEVDIGNDRRNAVENRGKGWHCG